jgi:hypothetical protein
MDTLALFSFPAPERGVSFASWTMGLFEWHAANGSANDAAAADCRKYRRWIMTGLAG